ncbi:MAG TPA: SO_0444 family Cu/Zn efflux transporter [Candidatus Hydrogenedens sp.]|nr:SO_0444 family Cu/Zn efflux transporter [Candidatus Hydrogenedens sp.]HOL19970.1 SO_0444 family Cu/Zn efflux transporter [Candidatus Hydrogenedens sp.]HPP59597.1 SO_0444 family Cu/Zn efflux transporter [Candidatus Hydrogenedens sp.]
MQFLTNFINIFAEMAPYLLFGFLIAGILSQILPTWWVKKHLSGKGYAPIFKSALIGIPLPLCSCGVIPVMASLRKQGANVPAMLAFILSTPQTGVDSILATYALLGLPLAIYRPFIALITAGVGGCLYYWISKRKVENDETTEINNNDNQINYSDENPNRTIKERVIDILHYGFFTLPREIAKPLIFGIIIAGVITTFIPPGVITKFLGNGILQIFSAILVGIPIYVCATASIPIALSLIYLGASPGSALAFLIAGPATNMATIAVVKQFLGKKAVIIYVLTMIVSALFFGLTFDWLTNYVPSFQFSNHVHLMSHSSLADSPVKFISLLLLTIILILSTIKIDSIIQYFMKRKISPTIKEEPYLKIKVDGMTCSHCLTRVNSIISNISEVKEVDISLEKGIATIYGKPSFNTIRNILIKEGYTSEIIEDHTTCSCHTLSNCQCH